MTSLQLTSPAPATSAHPRRGIARCAPLVSRHLATTGLAIFSICALQGCASSALSPASIPALTGAAGQQVALVEPPVDAAKILAVSDDMRRFVAMVAPPGTRRLVALEMLTQSIMSPGALALEYDASATFTASEAFNAQRGNCLSLSFMVAALAREMGLDVNFQQVPGEPEWDIATGMLFSAGHINVTGQTASRRFVLDFYPDRNVGNHNGERMRDHEALAHYYNNLGAQHLVAQELAAAYVYFTRAIHTAPKVASAWSNLGVVLRRNQQGADAERVLRWAIALDGSLDSAQNNLAAVLHEQGKFEQAQAIHARVKRARERNPFYHLAQADRSINRQQPAQALDALQRALELRPDNPVFLRHAARIAATLEQPALSRQLSEQASGLTDTRPF